MKILLDEVFGESNCRSETEIASNMLAGQGYAPVVDNTYQYIPYRFDYRVLTDNFGSGELRQMTEDLLHECFG